MDRTFSFRKGVFESLAGIMSWLPCYLGILRLLRNVYNILRNWYMSELISVTRRAEDKQPYLTYILKTFCFTYACIPLRGRQRYLGDWHILTTKQQGGLWGGKIIIKMPRTYFCTAPTTIAWSKHGAGINLRTPSLPLSSQEWVKSEK